MADDDTTPKVAIPRNMRPRATPNAEMNAQNKDSFLRQISGEPAPAVADVPLRGYSKGGMVKHGSSTHVTCKSKG